MCAYVFVSVCRFSLFKPVTGARVYFFLSNFPDPVEPIVLRNGNPFGFFRISFGLTRLMNGVLRSEKDKQVLPHMHAHTHAEGRMPPNVFCLVIVLFCARQIDNTPATVTNFQFSIFIAGFTFPTTCPAGSLCIRLRFLCATCAAAETVSNLKKKNPLTSVKRT